MPRKYALDTNVFIHAMRTRAWNEALQVFRAAYIPFEHLSAVVAQELLAGSRTRAAIALLEREVLSPFERRRRIFAPSFGAWKLAGTALAAIARNEGWNLAAMKKSLVNDALLAASCAENGITLVTQNVRDFERLRATIPVSVAAPWPRF